MGEAGFCVWERFRGRKKRTFRETSGLEGDSRRPCQARSRAVCKTFLWSHILASLLQSNKPSNREGSESLSFQKSPAWITKTIPVKLLSTGSAWKGARWPHLHLQPLAARKLLSREDLAESCLPLGTYGKCNYHSPIRLRPSANQ